MTNEERAALVHKVAAKVAGEACPGGTPPCVEEGYHRESCGCMDVAAAILAAIEPAIRADEKKRVVVEVYPLVGILWMAEEWREHIGWGSDYTGEYLDALEKADAAAAALRALADREATP